MSMFPFSYVSSGFKYIINQFNDPANETSRDKHSSRLYAKTAAYIEDFSKFSTLLVMGVGLSPSQSENSMEIT